MTKPNSRLDSRAARLVAVLVVAAVAGILLRIHWTDLFPPDRAQAPPTNPDLAACLEKRTGDVAAMRDAGTISEAQARQFRERAEDYCHGRFGEGGEAAQPGGSLKLPE